MTIFFTTIIHLWWAIIPAIGATILATVWNRSEN